MMKNLKQRIQSGQTALGCWINMGSLVSTEIVGRAGFDWLLIDLEHGAGDDTIMYQQLQVLESIGATPIVRTNELSREKVQRILDAGAGGIMFPQLQQAEEADQAVRLMYYPPRGTRGMAKSVRAHAFGRNSSDYISNLEKTLISVIQIETVQAVKEIDAIAATPGVDVLFVGPSDLSLAYGIFGQLDHPVYQEALRAVVAATKKHNKAAGVLLQDVDEYDMYYKLGYRFLACGADGYFVSRGADELIKRLRGKG
ncbi:MAG: aldolase/citrate lyase family protein [Cyclobacteriaceae bacterium]